MTSDPQHYVCVSKHIYAVYTYRAVNMYMDICISQFLFWSVHICISQFLFWSVHICRGLYMMWATDVFIHTYIFTSTHMQCTYHRVVGYENTHGFV